MKRRIGFVANSSSCSFVVVANQITSQELLARNYKYNPMAFGYYDDGDFFPITPFMLEFMKRKGVPVETWGINTVWGRRTEESLRFFDCFSYGEELNSDNIPSGFKIFPLEVSYHETNDDTFVAHYYKNFEEEEE